MGYARIQADSLDVNVIVDELRHPRVGGVATYVGTVRHEDGDHRVDALTYEAFVEMAERELEALRQEAVDRFGLVDAILLHRIGRVTAGENVLLVALSAAHRQEAFAALPWVLDRLKERVPIWKQEVRPDGTTWILGSENERVNV